MSEKTRWIVIGVAILAGVALTAGGFISGEQWLTFAGGLLTGGAGTNVMAPRK